ncbi:TetR family transcriptional regulator [Herbidospora galbida]|uniref:TetR family transcriptional regulator n=1 Tax=Herbidospora galbida TaxID=2575442 RepID=A0A4U3MET2_9ACTN|nr:TetR family transcriptional regulator [Herbidospora galbida]TKK87745.1 TetR family transcriptional regulator [Herbidospora galbida]
MGLRERKKAETRQAVHEAALRLTVELGFDAVTVEAIADAANISRRTFSNYFAGKEDAVLYGEEQRIQDLVERIRRRPEGERAWPALCRASAELYEDQGKEADREWAMRTRLARRHPALLARQLANQALLEQEIAVEVAAREGLDDHTLRPRVMATAFLAALRVAIIVWLDERESRPLGEVLQASLAEMGDSFTGT